MRFGRRTPHLQKLIVLAIDIAGLKSGSIPRTTWLGREGLSSRGRNQAQPLEH